MTKTTLQQEIRIKKKIKDVSDSSWDKITIVLRSSKMQDGIMHLGWEALWRFGLDDLNNRLFFGAGTSGPWSFINEEVFNETRNLFTDGKNVFQSLNTMGIENPRSSLSVPRTWRSSQLVPRAAFVSLLVNNADQANIGGGQLRFRSNDFFIHSRGEPFSRVQYAKIRSPQVLNWLKKYCPEFEFEAIYSAGAEVERSEVGLPEPVVNNPTPPPAPGPGTNTGNTSGGNDGMGSSGGNEKPGGNNLEKLEIKSTEPTQQRKNGFVLIGLISIIIIASMAVIWRQKKTLKK